MRLKNDHLLKLGIAVIPILLIVLLAVPQAFAETRISDKVVVLHTPSGQMVIELFPDDAPVTVENFLNLTEHQFYDRTIFHRVIKDFMIQGGDPKTKPGAYKKVEEWGTGDAGYLIPGEFNNIMHKRGIVSMARGLDPDSGSSQFFIVHKDSPHLDRNYAAFGRLATNSSYVTLDKIANLETGGQATNDIPLNWGQGEILKAEVKQRSEIPDLLDLGEPERVDTPSEQMPQKYSNEKLGISFDAPAGWLVQEPPKRNSQTPDIVAVGSKIGGFTPAISVSIIDANGTSITDYAESIKKSLKPAIEAGTVKIISEESSTINGNEAFIRYVDGNFDMDSGLINVKFKEVVIKKDDKFYVLTYTNSENDFAKSEPKFQAVIDTFQISTSYTTPPTKTPDEKNGGCLIATAAYGTEMSSQVQMLRELRQNVLFSTGSGTAFMTAFNHIYYSFSPTISDLERQSPLFKELVRITITPMLSTLSILSYADVHSEQQVMGYGIGIILLNILMYFALPAMLLVKLRDHLRN
ncbi:Peptidylprolyl isomerase [Candidatus Nitrosotenuis uzonensis]|uniref:peptidylprolyl isomerase n=1 Tax=Candidatus Nitrosotenuis uzonensis TaxID=1407055 RepID=A0A812F251_9ARCH|nr:Peptidylprolyl isomerase [Candidatus Nitrosotenuis uzonensis]